MTKYLDINNASNINPKMRGWPSIVAGPRLCWQPAVADLEPTGEEGAHRTSGWRNATRRKGWLLAKDKRRIAWLTAVLFSR
jgi:hypothetical protein